ncbi:hypothetical protein LXL04_027207 [Taraxacum kok-saghyz]
MPLGTGPSVAEQRRRVPSRIFIKQTLMNSPTFVLTLSKLIQSQWETHCWIWCPSSQPFKVDNLSKWETVGYGVQGLNLNEMNPIVKSSPDSPDRSGRKPGGLSTLQFDNDKALTMVANSAARQRRRDKERRP